MSFDVGYIVVNHSQCMEFLKKYCGFGETCAPTEHRYDLTCKAALCLIAMDDHTRGQSYVESFVNEGNEIEKYGDLWFQIAEKYLAAYKQFADESVDRTHYVQVKMNWKLKYAYLLENRTN